MGEFKEIFKKVKGWQKIREYGKAHVLSLALLEVVALGTSRKSLEIVRLAVQNKIFRTLKKENLNIVKNFKENNKLLKKNHSHRRTIWTIWLQGMENAPKIVQVCYDSLKKNIKDREIVVITENNYSNYVSFPEYIMDKYKKGIISKVHFADLLRVELLARYGGTWLDGTVFCSGLIADKHDFYLDSDLFLYQSLKPGLDGHSIAVSSWMITACANQNIVLLTRELLHNYWKRHNYAIDYFILHNFFQIALEAYPDEWKNVVPVSNSMPHVLLLRLFDQYNEDVWNAVKFITPFHKLSYKYELKMESKKDTFYDILINGNK